MGLPFTSKLLKAHLERKVTECNRWIWWLSLVHQYQLYQYQLRSGENRLWKIPPPLVVGTHPPHSGTPPPFKTALCYFISIWHCPHKDDLTIHSLKLSRSSLSGICWQLCRNWPRSSQETIELLPSWWYNGSSSSSNSSLSSSSSQETIVLVVQRFHLRIRSYDFLPTL